MAHYGFNLDRTRKKSKRKVVLIISFACFAVLLGAFSTFLLWRSLDYDFNNFIKNEQVSTTVPETVPPETAPAYSGEYAFCTAVVSDDKTEVFSVELICIDLEKRTVRIVPIDTQSRSGTGTVADLIVTGSGSEIKTVLGAMYDININRYVILTQSRFKSVFRVLGELTINISDDISFDNDEMFLELPEGENRLDHEKVGKYLRYINYACEPEEAARKNAEITVAAFNSYYNADNYRNADALFEKLINYCESDITIVDFTNSLPAAGSLVPASSKEHLKVYISDKVREQSYEEE